jgi:hypothetical protein
MVQVADQVLQENDDCSEEEQNDDYDNSQSMGSADVPSESNLRQMVLESTDSLDILAQKAKARGGGPSSERARFLFVTTW